MIKDFLPAIDWLEQDYEGRNWRVKPHRNPDWTAAHPEMDQNIYRRGPFQILDTSYCGESLADMCTEREGRVCDHGEHDGTVECWCLPTLPAYIWGLSWTEDDEHVWLTEGHRYGDGERHSKYLRAAHPYAYGEDERPNNVDWWKEDGA